MGLVSSRWAAVLFAVAVAIPAVAWAQTSAADSEYNVAPQTKCWSCHQTPQKLYPKLTEFVTILPPASVSASPGTEFSYVVQIQSTWGTDLRFIRPTMDLTNASSLAFVSNVPDFNFEQAGEIPVTTSNPTGPQNHTLKPVDIPVGLSYMLVELIPDDQSQVLGPDLMLKITTPTGQSLTINNHTNPGPPETGRGVPETFVVPTRDEFGVYGYGNWTFEAIVVIASQDPTQLGNLTLPSQQYPYKLKITATADAIEARQLSIPVGGDPIKPGQSRGVAFSLIALKEPVEGEETVRLWVDSWVHYDHDESPPNPNDENITREFEPAIAVGPGVTLTADTATAILVPGVQNGATLGTLSEIIGYAAAFLLISSVWTGGMFGKASRRQLNSVFGTAKRRVAFHNFLSYGILLAAAIHTVLFIVETAFYWTLGVIWGGLAILAMFGLGLTGAFQVQMIRKWSYGFWRWTHYGMAVAAIVFTLVHGLLDGVHFAELRKPLGWEDPLDPRDLTV